MFNSVIVVSNMKGLNEEAKNIISSVIDIASNTRKNVHIFKEDTVLYDFLRDSDGVKYIHGLSPVGGDRLLFDKINTGFYGDEDKISEYNSDFSCIYKKSVSRFVTPKVSDMYDREEYNSRRQSVMYNRLRFAISQIACEYRFIVNITANKEFNLLTNMNPKFGDGKFIYSYSTLRNKGDFTVGGLALPETQFLECFEEVR